MNEEHIEHGSEEIGPRLAELARTREAPSCSLVQGLLPEAVAGDLEAETRGIVARHVSACHACGREWVLFRKAHRALCFLRREEEKEAGFDEAFFAELHRDILGEVRHRQQQAEDARRLRRASQKPLPLLSGLAGLAAALLLGFFLGSAFERSQETPEGAALTGSGGAPILRPMNGLPGGEVRATRVPFSPAEREFLRMIQDLFPSEDLFHSEELFGRGAPVPLVPEEDF